MKGNGGRIFLKYGKFNHLSYSPLPSCFTRAWDRHLWACQRGTVKKVTIWFVSLSQCCFDWKQSSFAWYLGFPGFPRSRGCPQPSRQRQRPTNQLGDVSSREPQTRPLGIWFVSLTQCSVDPMVIHLSQLDHVLWYKYLNMINFSWL